MTETEVVDPIDLQILRTHLEAIAEEGFRTIERTACSPVVTESLDAACALTDADGGLVAGGGRVSHHHGAAPIAVQSVLEIHRDTVVPGDVFFGNDPHSGIAVHPQDVMVLEPVFVGDELVAWVANTAHLSDLGGMTFGSFSPDATECYQEAIRMPPVRLFAGGVEQRDVWEILKNNVRLPMLDELDLRGLVAGCHVAREKLRSVIDAKGGVRWFKSAIRGMQQLTEHTLRRRIEDIADGVYRAGNWVEWDSSGPPEVYWVPCELSIRGDRMVFDFDGVAPQCSHYINSKPWIVRSRLATDVHNYLGNDLPYNQGVLDVVEILCPEGSLLNSERPAPIGAAHSDAPNLARILGTTCLVHALAASEPEWSKKYLTSQAPGVTSATQVWRVIRTDGEPDAVLMLDGVAVGSDAAFGRDGNDLTPNLVARQPNLELAQIEVLESRYPILITEKRRRPGAFGVGRWRSGAGCQMSFRPHLVPGDEPLLGTMYAKRSHLPFLGMAGGMPGPTTVLEITRADGSVESIAPKAAGVVLREGDVFTFKCISGGGYGDPLERDPDLVGQDVGSGRITTVEARNAYGVVLDESVAADYAATDALRAKRRSERLRYARPPLKPLDDRQVEAEASTSGAALYPGVERRGNLAFAIASGAPLAVAPDHWTDGCPVFVERHPSGVGGDLITEAYLDPLSGACLAVDARLEITNGRSFDIYPAHWVSASDPRPDRDVGGDRPSSGTQSPRAATAGDQH